MLVEIIILVVTIESMQYDKKNLLTISNKVRNNQRITPQELQTLLNFELVEKESKSLFYLKESAFPLALLFGFLFVTYAWFFDEVVLNLPSWTNMSPDLLAGVDYLWDFLGEPIGKQNILYHLPNVVLYTFGFFGIKKIVESVERKTWLDSVLSAQDKLKSSVAAGTTHFNIPDNHTLLFVGKGDFVGEQFAINHPHESLVIAETKPTYTNIWTSYDLCTLYDDLKNALLRSDAETAGEYVFFPVKDDQLFLPSEHAYDIAPHKLDILVQNIRIMEKEFGWQQNKIIIVGDSEHNSFVQTEDEKTAIKGTAEYISLESITKKHEATYMIDPTALVLKKIITIAHGRKIAFRATQEGIHLYKKKFYDSLHALGYKDKDTKDILTVGYDVYEDLTEQQTLGKPVKNYLPVVLSKQVADAVERNGYKKNEYIYVPDLVLEELRKVTK